MTGSLATCRGPAGLGDQRTRSASVLLFICLLVAGPRVSAQTFRFVFRADPAVLVADGHSTATLSVEVNNSAGADVSDGTEVKFVTTLGTVTESARLVNGTARAVLRSGDLAGVATVTAVIGISREQVEVEILPAGAAPSRESRLLRLSGDYVAYSVDYHAVNITGKATLQVRDLTFKSDVRMDVQLRQERVLAEGRPGENNVSVSNGVETVVGDQLGFELRARRGLMARAAPKPMLLGIQGDDLETEENAPADESLWQSLNLDQTQTWIICRRMVVFPQEKIQFHHASLFVNGIHVVSLPIHVLSLANVRANEGVNAVFGDRAVGFNSTGGFSLDVPFYYRANTRGTGALRLRRTGSDGFYTERSGWSLALEEQYTLGERGEGVFLVDQVPRSDWGVSLQHEQTFGSDERGFFYLDYPRHQDLFSRVSYYKRFSSYSFGAELYGSLPKTGTASGSSQFYWQGDPRPIVGTPLTYTLTGDLSLSKNVFGVDKTRFSQSADCRVYPPPVRLGDRTSLVSSVEVDGYHDDTGRLAASFGGNLSLRRSLGQTSSLTLGYTYAPRNLSFDGAADNKYLSLGLYASRGWRAFASVYGTRSLSQDSLFGYGTLAYRLTPKWNLGFESSYQDFSGFTFTDYEVSLGRTIGNLEARAAYSKSRKKLFFELGTAMY